MGWRVPRRDGPIIADWLAAVMCRSTDFRQPFGLTRAGQGPQTDKATEARRRRENSVLPCLCGKSLPEKREIDRRSAKRYNRGCGEIESWCLRVLVVCESRGRTDWDSGGRKDDPRSARAAVHAGRRHAQDRQG